MSRRFGSIRQIAFVVRDLNAALLHWTSALGVGPFFVRRRLVPENFQYCGSPSPAPCMSIALGNSGDLQVELIQQHDDQPSAWRDRLLSGQEGLQHVSSWLTRAEYDATLSRLRSTGVAVAQEGVVPGSGVRFAYFGVSDDANTLMFEIADVMEPMIHSRMKLIAEASRDWDGANPIREISTLGRTP